MLLKNKTVPPLETIYEESGSLNSSNIDLTERSKFTAPILPIIQKKFTGLISSRSIPSVDSQRQRTDEITQKFPVEVQYRDGSKCFIPPSNCPKNSYEKIRTSKPPLVIDIITINDLNRAGITPSISSSPSESELSRSSSSLATFRIIQNRESLSSSRQSNSRGSIDNDLFDPFYPSENFLSPKTEHFFHSPAAAVLNNGSRSAFRPVLKSNFNQFQGSIKPTATRPMPVQSSNNFTQHGSTSFGSVHPQQTQWFNVTSNSIYDIPRLSNKYSNVPLRIDLPVTMTTTFDYPSATIRDDYALKRRLLTAGLSLETVTLYERILRVADQQSKGFY